jgi:hypothetical protein
MFWLLMTLLVIVGGILILRQKAATLASEDEPWRRSLGEDAPLNIEEIRQAEDEWNSGNDWTDLPEDESWR